MDYRQPDLSVITVNYNGFHDTCEFIDSWTATVFSVSYEMIVIDNGSTANEAALLQKTYPFIQAVRSEQNLGFAGGNNLGINLAKGKYLFLGRRAKTRRHARPLPAARRSEERRVGKECRL